MSIVSSASPDYTCLMQSASSSRILRSFVLPDGAHRIVLYEWPRDKTARAQNLVCLDARGELLWAAELPPGATGDCFLDVYQPYPRGALRANTLSDYRVILHPGNGKILACARAAP